MSPLAEEIVAVLKKTPRQFSELVDAHMDVPWRQLLKAWGEVRAADILKRDENGAYCINAEI
jgi:hypothetical protein